MAPKRMRNEWEEILIGVTEQWVTMPEYFRKYGDLGYNHDEIIRKMSRAEVRREGTENFVLFSRTHEHRITVTLPAPDRGGGGRVRAQGAGKSG